MLRIAGVVAVLAFVAGGIWAVVELRTRTRRAALDEFARLNQQYDCCRIFSGRCPKEAYDRVRELAQGDDEVAYVARTQFMNVCPALGAKPPPPPPAPPRAPVMPVAEPPPPARVVERDGGTTYELGGQVASAGFVVLHADGGVRAIAYAEDGRCEHAAVALFDGDGRRELVLSGDTELGDLTIGHGVRVREARLDPSHCEASDAGGTRFVLEPGDGGQVAIAAVVAEIPAVPETDGYTGEPEGDLPEDEEGSGDYGEDAPEPPPREGAGQAQPSR